VNLNPFHDVRPAFCKSCGTILGYDARDEEGPVWVPVLVGVLSVAGVGRYCSHECRNRDPDYLRAFEREP
jgi:hypothetical protein